MTVSIVIAGVMAIASFLIGAGAGMIVERCRRSDGASPKTCAHLRSVVTAGSDDEGIAAHCWCRDCGKTWSVARKPT